MGIYHTTLTLENTKIILRSGQEHHLSRVLFIDPNKRLNDYNAPRA
jgi:hypothetical protein